MAANDHQIAARFYQHGYDCHQWSKPPNTDTGGSESHREKQQLQGTVPRLQQALHMLHHPAGNNENAKNGIRTFPLAFQAQPCAQTLSHIATSLCRCRYTTGKAPAEGRIETERMVTGMQN